jgi:hypothetical protein
VSVRPPYYAKKTNENEKSKICGFRLLFLFSSDLPRAGPKLFSILFITTERKSRFDGKHKQHVEDGCQPA